MTTELTPLRGDILPADNIARWTAVQTIINQVVPPSVIKTRPGRGGKTFSYVSHDWVTKTLNEAFGFDWDFEPMPETMSLQDDGIGLFCRLTVRIGEHRITKVEYGWKETILNRDSNRAMGTGEQIKSAISDGLRRCAMRLGLGLSLYGGEDEMTTTEVKTMLASYAKTHMGWDARKTFDWLKTEGYTEADLLPKRNEMYEALAREAGKAGVTEDFDEPEPPAPVMLKPRVKLEGIGKDPADLIAQGKAAIEQKPTEPDEETPGEGKLDYDLTPPKDWTELWARVVTDLRFTHKNHARNTYEKIFPNATAKNPPALEDAWNMLVQHQQEAGRL